MKNYFQNFFITILITFNIIKNYCKFEAVQKTEQFYYNKQFRMICNVYFLP